MSVAHGSDSRDLSTGLTLAFGEIGATVLLIDADFRSERLRSPFLRERESTAAPDTDGLAGILAGRTTLQNETTEGPNPNIWHLRTGTPSGTTTQQLGSDAMRRLRSEASQRYDYVLIVSPPVLERSEATVLASEADITVVVVAARATKRGDVLFGLERLAGVGVTAPTLVLDDVARLDMQPARPLFLGSGNHINTSSPGPLR
jgi:succinoglycan biosynthesis transport protein ExoP